MASLENTSPSVQALIQRFDNRDNFADHHLDIDLEEIEDIFSETESNGTYASDEINDHYGIGYANAEHDCFTEQSILEFESNKNISITNNHPKFNLLKTLEYIEWLHLRINKDLGTIEQKVDQLIIRQRQVLTNKVIIITILVYYGYYLYPILMLFR